MKDGHKKGKAKATPSGKKSSKAAKKSKTGESAHSKKSKAAVAGSKGNGKGRGRGTSDAVAFHNPIVAAAFKRAVKKYPTAFRRLTD